MDKRSILIVEGGVPSARPSRSTVSYVVWAAGLNKAPSANQVDVRELSYLGLGLAGAAKFVEHLKKFLRDGLWSPDKVADGLGDVACYWRKPVKIQTETVTSRPIACMHWTGGVSSECHDSPTIAQAWLR